MRERKTTRPEEERFWAKVNKTETCWLWTATRFTAGYGAFRTRGNNVQAHRWAYEALIGPIPEGRRLRKLCDVRRCVNPEHYSTLHCSRGHTFDAANTYIDPNGRRICRACGRDWQRAARARRTL